MIGRRADIFLKNLLTGWNICILVMTVERAS